MTPPPPCGLPIPHEGTKRTKIPSCNFYLTEEHETYEQNVWPQSESSSIFYIICKVYSFLLELYQNHLWRQCSSIVCTQKQQGWTSPIKRGEIRAPEKNMLKEYSWLSQGSAVLLALSLTMYFNSMDSDQIAMYCHFTCSEDRIATTFRNGFEKQPNPTKAPIKPLLKFNCSVLQKFLTKSFTLPELYTIFLALLTKFASYLNAGNRHQSRWPDFKKHWKHKVLNVTQNQDSAFPMDAVPCHQPLGKGVCIY